MSQAQSYRKRVSVACDVCRRKRIKCDGAKPSCAGCLGQAEKCEYQYDKEKRKPPTKQHIQALQARIEFLESQLAQYQHKEGKTLTTSTHQMLDRDETFGSKEPSGTQPRSLDPIDDITDLLGGLSIGEGDQLRYFGSRSNLSFVERQGTKHTTFRQNSHQPLQRIDMNAQIQEELLDIYWKWQNPWQYLVYQKMFLRGLENQIDDGYCTPLLLYSMMALAARYSDNPEVRTVPNDPSTAGDGFSHKARALLFEEIKAPRVSTVVAAAHISLYEMAKDNEPAGWIYLGIAIRMAYNLGLHIDPHLWVSSGFMASEDAELRSIAWWGCYIIEKLFTVGIGRPSIIHERDIQVNFPSNLADVEYGQWNGDSMPSIDRSPLSYSITTFHNTCRLLRLATRPLDDIYTPEQFVTSAEKKSIMTKTNIALTSFYNNLPSVLRLPPTSSRPLPPHMYCFHMHFYTLVILLHRPFIIIPSNARPPQRSMNGAVSTSLETCTKAAEKVTVLLRAYAKFFTLRKISISVVDPARTAAFIHLFNSTSKDHQIRDKSRQLFLETLRYLEQMSIAWGWAKRSVRALGMIARKWRVHDILNNQDSSSVEPSLAHQDEHQGRDSELAGDFDSWLQGPFDLPSAIQVIDNNNSSLGEGFNLEQELFHLQDFLSVGDDAYSSSSFLNTDWEHELGL
ncbi:fungal-specific transcription factor domain-domain-containing protein [Aspergillus welwitschiae]|uniref:Fungal-specific transcription factor domain-domain-containing protein n=1 Tax=Aspergillus welwitschiae TaxID=1341132 RepID=A0A3F3PM40_9EURO|nr:fungal-specific transcription factor domain-domain-containing protein [Aspergillus welwitschiae]RDH27426.1 fungal-specific transcription factor domain-domain-containing protein [Aspergillus welwitschiae]